MGHVDVRKLEMVDKIKRKTREKSLQTINAFKDFESMDNTSLLTIARVIESYNEEKEKLGRDWCLKGTDWIIFHVWTS